MALLIAGFVLGMHRVRVRHLRENETKLFIWWKNAPPSCGNRAMNWKYV